MKVVALVSGGKDSTFNMMQCIAAGHQIVALANLVPHNKTEIDSYMYQSVGHEAIDLIAQAIDLPIFKKITYGVSKKQGKTYEYCKNDEVEDLYNLLQEIQAQIEFDAVSVGAILSDYQRVRVENVCLRLNLTPLAYLWQRKQEELLDEMIKCEVDAVVIKVACLGLDPKKHLGRSLSLLQPHLLSMHEKYGLNVCGEGGEYETLTLDCPLFKSRLVIEEHELVMHQNDPIAPVGFLKFNSLKLEFKLPPLDLQSRLEGLPLKDSLGYISDDDENDFEINNIDEAGDCDNIETLDNEEVDVKAHIQQKPSSYASKEGWLWVGGIQGHSSDPAGALEEAISKLTYLLSLKNHTIKDVCSIALYVSDMSQFALLNEVYIKTFSHVNPPTRACVQVPLNCPVILEALSWKLDNEEDKQTMHVQSVSHWAPCNIGPYSQANKIGDFIHLAGQIALVPGNMQMVPGGIKPQCKLVVRHIDRVLKAIDVNIRDVVQGICFVTHSSYIEPARKHWEAKTNNALVEYVVVTGLPRGALIEWHVWAHKHNNQFEYEERGKCIDDYSILLYRRVNYENNVAATVCRIESQANGCDSQIFFEALNYSVQKLKQGHENDSKCIFNLKIYFSILKFNNVDSLVEVVENYAEENLVYTFVPVVKLKSSNTLLSICGIRNQ
ncbi:unnamed protein product [Ceutorhynchus assimilis]|uniref:Diphthine--ammonia ligase n=1 Tax=Ceutorhynchus assimilis TaxID=467358 RepID=A0A9P0DCN6_9CUCU|nr:unnamed protein product [Ceutorhynchus assimilis]